jgi:hypothetical protein
MNFCLEHDKNMFSTFNAPYVWISQIVPHECVKGYFVQFGKYNMFCKIDARQIIF